MPGQDTARCTHRVRIMVRQFDRRIYFVLLVARRYGGAFTFDDILVNSCARAEWRPTAVVRASGL